MAAQRWKVLNPEGERRVVVTKDLPGKRWIEILAAAGLRIEVSTSDEILSTSEIRAAIGDRCEGCIGQLTERWGEELFSALEAAGGKAYSNYAVGYDNVDLAAATRHGIAVGNTPGVLTETTAEMAVALTFAAARRIPEGDRFMRQGRYRGWLPTLLLGQRLQGLTLGVVGAGRIGSAYARMMVEGHKMHLLYYDLSPKPGLEEFVGAYGRFLAARGEKPVTCRRAETLEELLSRSDVVSLHTVLDATTRHMIDKRRLALMKGDAILVNTSRGPLVDEKALVEHCRCHPSFRAALDVYEHEPEITPALAELDNVVLAPHLGSATTWTREAMAVLAATNVAGILMGYPVWPGDNYESFLDPEPPRAAPSILNGRELGLPVLPQPPA